MSFPRYSNYRDSGIEWLGQVPSHWDVRRVRWLCEIKKRVAGELGHDVLSITQKGIKVKDIDGNDGQLSMDYSKYQRVEVGDFAMNHMDLLTGFVDIASMCGVTSPDYRVFTVRDSSVCNSKYLLYILQMGYVNKIFFAYGQGSAQLGRWRLPTEQFNDLGFPLPPLEEQERIVTLLDREVAKNEALMSEQQRLIDLLKEKRQAAISHTVTKGLNPDVPMQESGVQWLGAVPAHWKIATVRRIVERIEQGWSPECLSRPAASDEWGVVKSGCVNRGFFSENENKALPTTLDPMPGYEIHAGDVLMSRASGSPELVGSTAFITATRPKLMLSDKIFRIHTASDIDPEYFVALFNSRLMRLQIERAISGADGLANNLPQSAMRTFACAIPPIEEQRTIVRFLSGVVSRMDDLISEAQHAIDLLQERRAALVSAAVTGKIDVRNLAVQVAA